MEAYLSLNRHLDELRTQIDQLANENSHHKVSFSALSLQLSFLVEYQASQLGHLHSNTCIHNRSLGTSFTDAPLT